MVSLETPVCEFGLPALPFELEGTDGKTWSLESARGPNGLLVMFICNHCPYVKAILDRIIRDTAELKEYGIGSIAVMSNDPTVYEEDSFDNMKALAESMAFPFPYTWDKNQSVAEAYGAICTPDFFGFDNDGGLQYRGRLDESGSRPADANARRELFEAMAQVAETGHGPTDQTPSMGCSIKWKAA